MAEDIDVSGWPYTGEKYESDYSYRTGCTCSSCMNQYKLAPKYNTIRRPVMRTKTIDERQNEMAIEHDKVFGAGSWPWYERKERVVSDAAPVSSEAPMGMSMSNFHMLMFFLFIILVVVIVYQRIRIGELSTRVTLFKDRGKP